MDDEMASAHAETDAGTLDINRTLESLHEPRQSIDITEQPQLRNTDFEAEICQESLNRKRQRNQNFNEESPLAKRSYLPFPHNYLAEYNQLPGNSKQYL